MLVPGGIAQQSNLIVYIHISHNRLQRMPRDISPYSQPPRFSKLPKPGILTNPTRLMRCLANNPSTSTLDSPTHQKTHHHPFIPVPRVQLPRFALCISLPHARKKARSRKHCRARRNEAELELCPTKYNDEHLFTLLHRLGRECIGSDVSSCDGHHHLALICEYTRLKGRG